MRWRRNFLAHKICGTWLLWGLGVASEPIVHEYVDLGSGSELLHPTAVEAQHTATDASQRAEGTQAEGTRASAIQAPATFDDSQQLSPTTLPRFSIDRDTSRPDEMDYEDPFIPTIAPFKRSIVYDDVDATGQMKVFDSGLIDLPHTPHTAPGDETFHATWDLQLLAGQALPLPSVAPSARWVLAQMEPPTDFQLLADSADNWFVRTAESGTFRLTLQVAGRRDVFGSDFPDVSRQALNSLRHRIPPAVESVAREIATHLGLSPTASPRQIVRTLIRHFRAFQPSERMPQGRGLRLFRELALGGRGICRHRAYSFAVLALGLGVPTRYAMNEAHAWVEVFDGSLWHRIDLGGAAGQLAIAGDPNRPQHVPSPDPYDWPPNSHPGEELAREAAEPPPELAGEDSEGADSQQATQSPTETSLSSAEETLEEQDGLVEVQTGQALEQPGNEPPLLASSASKAQISISIATHRTARGRGLAIAGRAMQADNPCSNASIDILLQNQGAAQTAEPLLEPGLALGTLVTKPDGHFSGQLVIPWTLAVGDYRVMARLSENSGNCHAP